MRHWRIGVIAVVAFVTGASRVMAQAGAERRGVRAQPEVRADFIGARAEAAHLGVGVAAPVGTFVRLGLVGAAGYAWTDDGSRLAGRVDALARFVADPLRESRWAPYASGGVGALFDERERWRAVLVGVLGLEGPPHGGIAPAIEVGFGGGLRVGVVVRRALRDRR